MQTGPFLILFILLVLSLSPIQGRKQEEGAGGSVKLSSVSTAFVTLVTRFVTPYIVEA